MIKDKSRIHRIFLFSLSNIGDVILTFPVIDILKRDFPDAQLDVAVGPKAVSLLQGNEAIHEVMVFNKRMPLKEMMLWIKQLRRNQYDLFVDLRNTMVPLFAGGKFRTSMFMKRLKNCHMRRQHLNRLCSVHRYGEEAASKRSFVFLEEDKNFVYRKLGELASSSKPIVISPGAAAQDKRWPDRNYAALCRLLLERYQRPIILVGDGGDKEAAQVVMDELSGHSLVRDWTGETSLTQLGCLLARSLMLISNDSSPMHLASYLDIPTLALFGPTNPLHYGPWGKNCLYIKKTDSCPRCREKKGDAAHTCMAAVSVDDVVNSFRLEQDTVSFKENE